MFSPDSIADRLEIDQLLTLYAIAVDARDWERCRALFTDDAVLDYSSFGGPRAALDQALAWVRDALTAIPVTQHLVTNKLIALNGDSATAQCEVLNPLMFDGGKVVFVGGSYYDRLVRTGDGWRIAERVAKLSWSSQPIVT